MLLRHSVSLNCIDARRSQRKCKKEIRCGESKKKEKMLNWELHAFIFTPEKNL